MKRLLIILYICLVGLLAVTTFVEQAYGTDFVERNIYHTCWFCCLWGTIATIALVLGRHVYGTFFVKRNFLSCLLFCLFGGKISPLSIFCSHPTRFMATVPHIVVSWLPPRYLGGGHDYVYRKQKRIRTLASGGNDRQFPGIGKRQKS